MQSFLIFNDSIEHSVRRWITKLFAKAGNAVFSHRFAQVCSTALFAKGKEKEVYANKLKCHEVPWCALTSSGSTHGTEMRFILSPLVKTICTLRSPQNHIFTHPTATRSYVFLETRTLISPYPSVHGSQKTKSPNSWLHLGYHLFTT